MPDNEHLNGWSKWSEYVLRTLESMVSDLKTVWDKQIRQEILFEQFENIQSQLMERVRVLQERISEDKNEIKTQLDERYRTLDNKIDAIQAERIKHRDRIIEKTLGDKVKAQAKQAAPAGAVIAIWEIVQHVLQWAIENWDQIKLIIGG